MFVAQELLYLQGFYYLKWTNIRRRQLNTGMLSKDYTDVDDCKGHCEFMSRGYITWPLNNPNHFRRFHCLDIDDDGIISSYELAYFYEEQMQRQIIFGIPEQDRLQV
ncbi:hypothetical protein BC936DRAFT_142726 [Jimgerdemannia flammicorona]|uniref:EF-hand domain-containing protein n=1 Tax=Jimgerdemannia flammicorona TaxID=994334 RepID=A0A432ZZW7_9FUNG|nr:hypothetical protein BC936DRAFT_142726 [Jimgerdemannia flammicorona]